MLFFYTNSIEINHFHRKITINLHFSEKSLPPGAHGLGEGAAYLSIHQLRIEHAPGIVQRHVAIDTYLAGDRVDLDAAVVEDEAVAKRAVDQIVVVRRLKLWR